MPTYSASIQDKVADIHRLLHTLDYTNIEGSMSSVMSGHAGFVLYYAHLSKIQENEALLTRATDILYSIFDNLQKGEFTYTYCNGLAGFGWLFQHLCNQQLIEANPDEILSEIDDIIIQITTRETRHNNFDFLHGAIGNAIYLLSRLTNKKVANYLPTLLQQLQQAAITDANGTRWLEKPFYEKDKNSEIHNLGLSHGLSSYIVFFSKALQKNIAPNITKPLLRGSIDYLQHQKNKEGESISCFPSIIKDGKKENPSRLAWCYGDLGIGIALWQAGIALQDPQLQNEAIQIYQANASRKEPSASDVKDAGFCHGSIGIAHMYQRMYFNTKLPLFAETAQYWYEQTLQLAKFPDGLAGYKTWLAKEGWQNDHSLLMGISGIGLALAASQSQLEPTWDECFLLS